MKFNGPIDLSIITKGKIVIEGPKVNLLKTLTPSIKKQFDLLVSSIYNNIFDISSSSGISLNELYIALKEHILFESPVENLANHYSHLIDKSLGMSMEDFHHGGGLIKIKQKLIIPEEINKKLEIMSADINKELTDIAEITGISVNDVGNLFFNQLSSFAIKQKHDGKVNNSLFGRFSNRIQKILKLKPIVVLSDGNNTDKNYTSGGGPI